MQFKKMMMTISATTILAGAAGAQVSFESATPFATPSQPDGVAAADFNADGNLDLAVTTDAPDKITLLMGNGLGGFAPGATILTGNGTGPGYIVAADMDNDGDQDLVVALHNSAAVRVYINSAGTFAQGAQGATGADPRGLALGHFDGNGLLDVASANRDGNNATILLNQGGSFSVTNVAVGAEPRRIASADFDAVNGPDLVVTNHDDRTLSILSNNGAGGFSVSATLNVNPNTRPEGVTTADMDGDGDADIVAATNGDGLNFTTVFINSGGSFTRFDYTTPGSQSQDVIAADFDIDGDMDVLVSNDSTNNVVAMENGGAGALAAGQVIRVGATPEALATGDFDNDGAIDAAVTARDSDQTWVLINGADAGCPADCNADGSLSILDFVCFQAEWQAQSPLGDCDNNGVFNIIDFVCFQTLFQAGCP